MSRIEKWSTWKMQNVSPELQPYGFWVDPDGVFYVVEPSRTGYHMTVAESIDPFLGSTGHLLRCGWLHCYWRDTSFPVISCGYQENSFDDLLFISKAQCESVAKMLEAFEMNLKNCDSNHGYSSSAVIRNYNDYENEYRFNDIQTAAKFMRNATVYPEIFSWVKNGRERQSVGLQPEDFTLRNIPDRRAFDRSAPTTATLISEVSYIYHEASYVYHDDH
jgi:hypothetical protein